MLWIIALLILLLIPQVRWVIGMMFLALGFVALMQWIGIAPEDASGWYTPTLLVFVTFGIIGEVAQRIQKNEQ